MDNFETLITVVRVKFDAAMREAHSERRLPQVRERYALRAECYSEVLEAAEDLRNGGKRGLVDDPGDHPDADRPPGTDGSWGEA